MLHTLPNSPVDSLPLLLADAFVLVSWWKPLILLVPLIPWMWLVSKVFDKHAARFFLPREQWGVAHLCVGLVAFLIAIFLPLKSEGTIWIGFGIIIVLLAADVAAFMLITNRDDRVPEDFRLKLDFSAIAEAKAAKAAAKKQAKVELTIKSPDKSAVPPPMEETPEYQVRLAAESGFTKALEARASQLDFAPTGRDNTYTASYLVDGVRQSGDVIPGADAVRIMDFWKAAAKLDLNDRRRPLKADISVERAGAGRTVRVMSSGTQAGMRLTLLIDPIEAVRRKFTELGLLEPQLTELKKMIEEETGVVLLSAPGDAGRTTTIYALIKQHDAYTKNVQLIEVDQQDTLEGARQNIFNPAAEGPEFSTLVRSILRRDPDVLAIAELPDANTAKEVAKSDLERTRVYISMRADNAMAALQTYLKAVGDLSLAAKGLRGVLSQKLVRKLCTNCRVPYQPSPDMVKKLGLPPDRVKQLFKRGGQVLIKNKPEICPVCGGAGFIGQEGIFEVFPLEAGERAAIAAGDMNALKVELKKRNLPTMQQAALRKAIEGITSVEEVMRVTVDPKAGGEGGAPAAPKAPVPAT